MLVVLGNESLNHEEKDKAGPGLHETSASITVHMSACCRSSRDAGQG
jgi:hypothetical protein